MKKNTGSGMKIKIKIKNTVIQKESQMKEHVEQEDLVSNCGILKMKN